MNLKNTDILFRLWLLSGLVLFFYGCSRPNSSNIVAKVGNRRITADEFQWAYELAPRSVTQLEQDSARSVVLQRLVNRTLLASEGERKGYEQDDMFQKILNYYRDRAIARELYLKHVRDSVTISAIEFQQAYEKYRTVLYVQNFVAPGLTEAEEIIRGEQVVPHIRISQLTTPVYLEDYGPVDEIRWNVLNENVENVLYRLPVLEFSRPVKIGKAYHVFRVVEKEKELLERESNYYALRPTLESVLRKRKEHQKAFEYVRDTMTPQNVIIRAKTLNMLADRFWDFFQSTDDQQLEGDRFAEIQSLISAEDSLLNGELANFSGECFSTSDFIFYYRINPIHVNPSSRFAVRNSLQNIIATYVRDIVFARQGVKEGLANKRSVTTDTRQWREKLLAAKVKKNILNELSTAVGDSSLYRDLLRDSLSTLLTRLNNSTRVSINHELLATIPVSDVGSNRKIDFFAKHIQ